MDDEELLPEEDEVVIFCDYFAAGLVIPCHWFVLVVLGRYQIQPHEFTLIAFAHLSKFSWEMVSYSGVPDIEVFARHFVFHNQTRRARLDDVQHDCNYASYSFKPRRGENNNIMHCNKNKWSQNWAGC